MSETLTKEELKARRDKEAVAAMKAAKTNMETALSRIGTLENAVANFASLVDTMLNHIPADSFAYNSSDRNRDMFKNKRDEIMKWV